MPLPTATTSSGADGDTAVVTMSSKQRIAQAIVRALPLLPAECRTAFDSLFTPETLLVVEGTMVAWAASHVFGIGEILDLLVLVAGVVSLGKSALDVAQDLRSFALGAINAETQSDLDEAGRYFARAALTAGIDVVLALLLRRNLKTVRTALAKDTFVRPNVLRAERPPPPSAGSNFYRPRSVGPQSRCLITTWAIPNGTATS
jgi:hypothetical protein